MAFAYYSPVTVNSSQVPSTQTDFPMLVSYTDNRLKTVGNGGHVQNANGYDIRPYSDSGLTSALTYELEFYDASAGTVVMWVKIASLAVGSVVYLAYGDSGITTNGSSTSTWDTNFKGVYHLPNGTTLTAADSTSNANNGTLRNTPTATTGQIDGGALFVSASSQDISIPIIASLQNASKAVMSAWMKRTASGNNSIIMTDDGSNVYLFGIAQGGFWGSGNIAFVAEQGGLSWGTAAQNDANWHYVTLVYDGTQSTDATRLKGYVDGVQKTLTYNNTIPSTILGTNNKIYVGQAVGTGNYSDASMDEFRITTGAIRAPDWITTEYNNQSAPSTFATLGTEIDNGAIVWNIALV